MRWTLLIAFLAASVLAAAGCGSSLGGGTGGAGGSNGTGGATGTGGAADHGGASGGGGQGGSGAGPTDCNPPCTGQTVCVGSGTEGGAVSLPGDGGVCPAGRHLQGNTCVQDLGYACQPIPAGCNGTVTCTCASSTLCTGSQVCTVISAQEITCVLEVP